MDDFWEENRLRSPTAKDRTENSGPPPLGLTFDLSHGAQVLLKAVVELGIGDGLEVTGVNAP